jgi:secondary thiamine-phosphate synthase enzyme
MPRAGRSSTTRRDAPPRGLAPAGIAGLLALAGTRGTVRGAPGCAGEVGQEQSLRMETAIVRIRTGSKPAVRDITGECAEFAASAAQGGDGLLHVFVPHATAGLALMELGSGSDTDLLAALDELLPADDRWRHAHGSRGHGRSHVMPALIAPFLVVPVLGGRPALGTWQSIALIDLNVDNPDRQIRVSFLG